MNVNLTYKVRYSCSVRTFLHETPALHSPPVPCPIPPLSWAPFPSCDIPRVLPFLCPGFYSNPVPRRVSYPSSVPGSIPIVCLATCPIPLLSRVPSQSYASPLVLSLLCSTLPSTLWWHPRCFSVRTLSLLHPACHFDSLTSSITLFSSRAKENRGKKCLVSKCFVRAHDQDHDANR